MKKYEVFLFDADGTLYDFDRAEEHALKVVFQRCGFAYDEDVRARYQEINAQCWEAFEAGELSKEVITTLRFERLFETMEITHDASIFNEQYLFELGKGSFLIDGALDICREIVESGKQIYIITNGVWSVQEARVKYSLINPYILATFVSEEVGFQKPDMRYFEYVFTHIPQIDKEKMLVIGDSLSADIVGGNNAGLDTCWFNPAGLVNTTDGKPTYEVSSLKDLEKFI